MKDKKEGYKLIDSKLGVMFFDKDGNRKIVMESKYYTPEIEEFHVGFEYEAFHSKEWFFEEGGNQWVKSKVSLGTDILTLNYAINCDFVRVKYLDREDIESLGWKAGVQGLAVDGYSGWEEFKKDDYRMVLSDNQGLIIVCRNHTSFSGTIKNKSELKKLLKQLGI